MPTDGGNASDLPPNCAVPVKNGVAKTTLRPLESFSTVDCGSFDIPPVI